MRRIDFVTLRLFVAIADERSLTRAAEREHLALAAVSKRVSDLEGQLDVSLLYRQPKGVELTPDSYLDEVEKIMACPACGGPMMTFEIEESQLEAFQGGMP